MAKKVADKVLSWLSGRPQGSSTSVIARATGSSEGAVEDALDTLCDQGLVRLVRRTRTSDIWGMASQASR